MLGMILFAILAIVAVALAIAILRYLLEIGLRLLLASAIVLCSGLAGGAIASQHGYDGGQSGVVVAALTVIPALLIVWAWRGSVSDRLGRRIAKAPRPVFIDDTAKPIEQMLALEDSGMLSTAWADAQRLAPRDALDEDRNACAKFLASFAASADCDPAAIELATMIRRHVPALVSETHAVVDGANEEERSEIIDAMVADLRQVGIDARAALADQHLAARERLGIRRNLFAARAAKRRGW
jgi:hypothetical protein